MPGPLEGYRVVELAEGVGGPYCGSALGDAGADVVKIERPEGDRARGWGSRTKGDLGAAFQSVNRSTRSIALDPDTNEGAAVVKKLIAGADIVIADAGFTRHPDLQPDALMAAHPQLIYVQISEFGEHGPQGNQPPYGELVAQLASEATTSLGVIGESAVRLGNDNASMYAGIFATQAICAALLARDQQGGQRIDVSLFGAMLFMRSTLWVALSNPDEWWGFHLDSYVKPPEYGYRCSDGAVLFSLQGVGPERRDDVYQTFEMEWVRADPLFDLLNQDGGGVGRYSHVVRPLWERAFSKFTMDEVITKTRALGGQAWPKNSYEMLVNSDQVQYLKLIQPVETPFGPIDQMIPPWEFADTPAAIQRPAPRLGEHAAEVLAEAGYSTAEVAALRSRGVLAS
ncbi:MAG: CoA transferase [Dehalococcoidia bacterium]|nr:CoA transferase [Dehalococcoidia bacterium]